MCLVFYFCASKLKFAHAVRPSCELSTKMVTIAIDFKRCKMAARSTTKVTSRSINVDTPLHASEMYFGSEEGTAHLLPQILAKYSFNVLGMMCRVGVCKAVYYVSPRACLCESLSGSDIDI